MKGCCDAATDDDDVCAGGNRASTHTLWVGGVGIVSGVGLVTDDNVVVMFTYESQWN